MTLRLAVELTADASGLQGALRISKEDLQKLGGAATAAGDDARRAARGLDQLERNARDTDEVMRRLRQTLLALGGAALVRQLSEQADAWAGLQAQIALGAERLNGAGDAAERLFDIAQDAGAALGDTVPVFRSMARAAEGLDATADQVFEVTQAVERLGAIGRVAPTQLSAGLLQFGQAMGSTIVRAEEFNSLIENMPDLVVAVAQGLGMTTTELRNAVLSGQVLSRDVFEALLQQTGEIERKFAQLPESTARAAARFNNEMLRASGAIGRGGLTQALVDVTDQLRDAVATSDDFAERLGGTLGQVVRLLGGGMIDLAANIDLVVIAVSAFLGLNAAVQLTRMVAAVRAATGAWAVLNAVMRANPLGLLATVAGVAVGALIEFRDVATHAADDADEAFRRLGNTVREVSGSLDALTEGQRQVRLLNIQSGIDEQLEILRDFADEAREILASAFIVQGPGSVADNAVSATRTADFVRQFGDLFDQVERGEVAFSDLVTVMGDQARATEEERRQLAALATQAQTVEERLQRLAAQQRMVIGTATDADEALLGLVDAGAAIADTLDRTGSSAGRASAALAAMMAQARAELAILTDWNASAEDRLTLLDGFRSGMSRAEAASKAYADAVEAGADWSTALAQAWRVLASEGIEGVLRSVAGAASDAADRVQALAGAVGYLNALQHPRQVDGLSFEDPNLGLFGASGFSVRTPRASGGGGGGGGGTSDADQIGERIAALEAEAALEETLARLYGASEASLASLAEMREIATTAAQLGIETGTDEYRQLAQLISRRNAAAAAIEEEAQSRAEARTILERYGDAEDRHAQAIAQQIALLPQLIELTGSRAEAEEVLGRRLQDLEQEYREVSLSAQLAEGVFDSLGKAARVALRAIQDETVTTADIINAFVTDLIDMLYRLTIVNPLEAAFEGLLGSIDFGGLFGGGLFGGGGSLPTYPGAGTLPGTGGLYHSGGIVGVTAVPTRTVDARVWDHAPRFHTGGLVAGERPVIAKVGEVIGWPDQMRRAFGGDVEFVINDYRGAGAPDLEVNRSETAAGGQRIEITLREAVKEQFRQGRLDTTLLQRYGIRPLGKR